MMAFFCQEHNTICTDVHHEAQFGNAGSVEFSSTSPSGTTLPSTVLGVRTFASGATRDTEEGKLDYEGFLSPIVLRRFAQYMDKHRLQRDGSLRNADDWQQGIPREVYIKSLWRHFMDVWSLHRAIRTPVGDIALQEALCAVMFNAMGYLFEELRDGREDQQNG